MGDDTTGTSKIHDYYKLSCTYYESARISLKNELFEPAMFSAIHALELALKAALLTKIADGWKTHNIGGQFRKHFRKEVGDGEKRFADAFWISRTGMKMISFSGII